MDEADPAKELRVSGEALFDAGYADQDHADEVGWLRQCAGWLTRLHAGEFPPAVNLRPGGDHPERALVVVDLPRVAAILDRARRVDDLAAAAVLPGRRAERRRRVAGADLDFPGVLPPSKGPGILGTILGRQRGRAVPRRGTRHPSGCTENPFRTARQRM